MAGLGTRLRPHTWSKPKQLVSVAGKAALDHVIDTLSSLPEELDIELINIVGYLGEQIEDYFSEHYPNMKSHFVVQENPQGAVARHRAGAQVPARTDAGGLRRHADRHRPGVLEDEAAQASPGSRRCQTRGASAWQKWARTVG